MEIIHRIQPVFGVPIFLGENDSHIFQSHL
jgi:hypothetical protein